MVVLVILVIVVVGEGILVDADSFPSYVAAVAGSSSLFPDVGGEFWLLAFGLAPILLQKCTWVAMLTQVPSVLAPVLLRCTPLLDMCS